MVEQLVGSPIEPLAVRHEQVAVPRGPQHLDDPHRRASIRLDQQHHNRFSPNQPALSACPDSVFQSPSSLTNGLTPNWHSCTQNPTNRAELTGGFLRA